MRCSHPERARTFLFTTLLFLLSFTATLAESADIHGLRAHHAWRRRVPLNVVLRDLPTALASQTLQLPTSIASAVTSVLSVSTPTPTSLPSVLTSLPSPSPPTPSLPENPTTTSSSSSTTPSPTSTSTSATVTSTTIHTTSNGTPLSQSTSSQTTSSQPSSSQTSSSTKLSTSTAAAVVGVTAPAAQTLVTPVYSESATSYATGTIVSSTPSSTSSSNSGFFSNTGAVAGTFTVAGLLGVAGIIGTGMLIARRRGSRSYEDDMEYLEKRPEPFVEPSQSQNFVVGDVDESSDSDHFGNSMEVIVPPAAHFYPQQDVYFAHGQTANGSEGYENQGYYPQEVYAPHEYGIAYPPAEPHAAEEDPYGGIDEADAGMPNPFDNVTSQLPAALRPSGQQPGTVNLPPFVYRPPDPHHSIDSFYGSSTAASHGHVL